MTICKYCGSPIEGDVKFCTNCGAPVEYEAPSQPVDVQPIEASSYGQPSSQPYEQPYEQPQYGQQQQSMPYGTPPQSAVNDSGSIGWGILGAFFPIVGIILFFVWRTNKPQSAKVAIIGAAIGFAIGLLYQFMLR